MYFFLQNATVTEKKVFDYVFLNSYVEPTKIMTPLEHCEATPPRMFPFLFVGKVAAFDYNFQRLKSAVLSAHAVSVL